MHYYGIGLAVGAVCGAAFGAAFGAFASVFHGGPELAVGIFESWGWFAGLGGFAGFGMAHTKRMDAAAGVARLRETGRRGS